MKKIALTVLLTLAAFVGPQLHCSPPNGKSVGVAKDAGFEVLSKHGELYFTITTLQVVGVTGQWKAFVRGPDGKIYKNEKQETVNFADPSTSFIIKVKHPILRGPYTL